MWGCIPFALIMAIAHVLPPEEDCADSSGSLR